jgi:hypothetical protein
MRPQQISQRRGAGRRGHSVKCARISVEVSLAPHHLPQGVRTPVAPARRRRRSRAGARHAAAAPPTHARAVSPPSPRASRRLAHFEPVVAGRDASVHLGEFLVAAAASRHARLRRPRRGRRARSCLTLSCELPYGARFVSTSGVPTKLSASLHFLTDNSAQLWSGTTRVAIFMPAGVASGDIAQNCPRNR